MVAAEETGTIQNTRTARIARAAIWNTNLTSAEIVKLNLGWPPTLISPSSLVACWKYDRH